MTQQQQAAIMSLNKQLNEASSKLKTLVEQTNEMVKDAEKKQNEVWQGMVDLFQGQYRSSINAMKKKAQNIDKVLQKMQEEMQYLQIPRKFPIAY